MKEVYTFKSGDQTYKHFLLFSYFFVVLILFGLYPTIEFRSFLFTYIKQTKKDFLKNNYILIILSQCFFLLRSGSFPEVDSANWYGSDRIRIRIQIKNFEGVFEELRKSKIEKNRRVMTWAWIDLNIKLLFWNTSTSNETMNKMYIFLVYLGYLLIAEDIFFFSSLVWKMGFKKE